MKIDEQESYYYPLTNINQHNNYPLSNINQHDDFLYGLIYSRNNKTLQKSNNIIRHFSYMDYLRKSETTSIIPALKINRSNNNDKGNLKIALPLTDENDRANFMEPDQNLEEYNDNNDNINDDESFQV